MSAAAESVEVWSGKDRTDENFPVGMLMRPALRRHVHAYYAFARNADDIGDSTALAPTEKVARLDRMEAVLLGHAENGSESALRLRRSLAETGVDTRHATDLLVAFRQDATMSRYPDWDSLMEYCRYSAMPVGRYVLDLHGESPASHAASDALCASLQVLNHVQDAAKDLAELDRCYLPADMLKAAGASVYDLRQSLESNALRAVFTRILERVDEMNASAEALPRTVRDRRLRVETGVIVGLARRLARRLRTGDPVAARVRLTKTDAAMAGVSALRFLR